MTVVSKLTPHHTAVAVSILESLETQTQTSESVSIDPSLYSLPQWMIQNYCKGWAHAEGLVRSFHRDAPMPALGNPDALFDVLLACSRTDLANLACTCKWFHVAITLHLPQWIGPADGFETKVRSTKIWSETFADGYESM